MALIDFYGRECPHCVRMEPLIKRLEKEESVTVERLEVWHDEDNAAKMEQVDRELCGGVPFFYNTLTKKSLCGEVGYDELKRWALAKA